MGWMSENDIRSRGEGNTQQRRPDPALAAASGLGFSRARRRGLRRSFRGLSWLRFGGEFMEKCDGKVFNYVPNWMR